MNRENVMREALSDLEAQRASNIETERQRREEAPESKTARGARSKRLAGRLFAACVSLRNLQRYRICRGTDS